MDGLQQELDRMGTLLCSSLDNYLTACSSIQNYYRQANTAHSIPQAVSDRLAGEISQITSLYGKKLGHAKSALSQAINTSPAVVPISCLPSEILIRIFHMVVGMRPCGITRKSSRGTTLPKYPDYLSHVCTRWRQILMDSPTSWSHIDIACGWSDSWTRGFQARAKAFVARAGDSLLDVHVYEPDLLEEFPEQTIHRFLGKIAPRIRSLEFLRPENSELDYASIIGRCFEKCVPGTFTKLTLLNYSRYAPTTISNYDDPNDIPRRWRRTSGDLDDLLLQIKVVRQHGMYLPWTSQLYHGLVELRLDFTRHSIPISDPVPISDRALVNILSSSPRLRTLYFTIKLEVTLPKDSSISPVLLEDLEVLSFTAVECVPPGTFLRLLSPGPKPLKLSLYYLSALPLCSREVQNFFTRSNVVNLHVGFLYGIHQIIGQVVRLNPNLRVLTMTEFEGMSAPDSSHDSDTDASPISHQLDTLCLDDAHIRLDKLEQLLGQNLVKKLVMWSCRVHDGSTWLLRQELKTELSRLFPAIKCIVKW